MTSTMESSREASARRRAKYLADLIWHIGAFIIINALFWILDFVGPGETTWAFWITAFWGVALAFHVLTYIIDGRNLEQRKARQYLQED